MTSGWWGPHRREELTALYRRSRQVVLLAAATGLVTGFGVAAFERLVVEVVLDRVLDAPLPVLVVAPTAGLVVAAVALRVLGGGCSSATADEYLLAYHDARHPLGVRVLVARMVASLATLGTGGAMGLEGPSLYLGASIGDVLDRRLPRWLRGASRQTLLVAGAAAGVAAIFKAPATGAVFALEVPYQEDFGRRMLLPALVASATGYLAFVTVNGTAPLFPVREAPPFALRELLGAVALGVAAGLAARVFARGIRVAKRVAAATPAAVRIAGAGATLGAALVVAHALTGEDLTLGPGYETIAWATDPDRAVVVLLAVLVLRCVATTATVAGGGVGGLFIPLVVAGALLGRAVGGGNPADASLFVVVGVAAFLGAGYRVPLAAVMFVAETTGRPSFVIPGLLAAVAAELVMGAASVTAYQRMAGERGSGGAVA